MTHLVLDASGIVIAMFLSSSDAYAFSQAAPGRLHVPFNSDRYALPLLGQRLHTAY